MIELVIAVAFVVILTIRAVRANARFRDRETLPMQWSFTGKVSWTAPRRLALAFLPLLATVFLGTASMAGSLRGDLPLGNDGTGAPGILLIGLTFLLVQMLHLFLIQRTLD